MVAKKIDNVVGELREEADRLKGELRDAEKRADAIRDELSQIEGAIASLTGKASKRAGGKKRPGSKPALTTEEVIPLVAEVLADGPKDEKAIRAAVGDKAAAAGRSKSGLHLRIPKALASDRFAEAAGSYSLSK